MREILFRGKRNDNGDWVEGNLFIPDRHDTPTQILMGTNFIRIPFDVIPKTVGQYTGLTDKNGKKIFEGDIVTAPYIDPIFHSKWNEGNPTENTVVKYADGVFYIEYIESKHKITLFGLLDGEKEAEVIGNIHDNPELLKGVEQ